MMPPGNRSGLRWTLPARLSLGVFLSVFVLSWLLPPLLPHRSSTQYASLGASSPAAKIYLLQSEEGSERLIAESRALALLGNGTAVTGVPVPRLEALSGIYWVEIPPVIVGLDGRPFRPVWLQESAVDDYRNWLAGQLRGEVDLEGWIVRYRMEVSPLRFWLGTDNLGRDLLVRILEGGRLSIGVGLVATAVAVLIGMAYGGVSGYAGGRVDSIMMRLVDVLYALPFLIFVILLMVIFERSLWLLFLAIGAVEWLTTARIVRAEVMAMKKLPFVEASRCLGHSPLRILLRDILPNTLGPVTAYATLTVPAVILLESVLSFLGLGVQPPASSWGVLISEGADNLLNAPWMLIFPALIFSGTLLSLNLLGDQLKQSLDPRRRMKA